MSNIQGRVKHDIINELFRMGDLTNPDSLQKEITDCMKKFNKTQSQIERNNSKLGFFSKSKIQPVQKVFNKPHEFIHAIRNGVISNVSTTMPDDYFVTLWFQIQDVRTVLEVKCVSKNCQSNNVMADKNTLLALKRVVEDMQTYKEL